MCQRELVNEGFLIGCEVLLGRGIAPQRISCAGTASAQGVVEKKKGTRYVPFHWQMGSVPIDQFDSRSELLTNARCVPSGDHDGTLIVPWPP